MLCGTGLTLLHVGRAWCYFIDYRAQFHPAHWRARAGSPFRARPPLATHDMIKKQQHPNLENGFFHQQNWFGHASIKLLVPHARYAEALSRQLSHALEKAFASFTFLVVVVARSGRTQPILNIAQNPAGSGQFQPDPVGSGGWIWQDLAARSGQIWPILKRF